jgi:hypothetical protein
MQTIIKIILAALLLICLLDMPYSYYEAVRFIALVAFTFLAYLEYQNGNKGLGVAFIVLALLFQPFFKIALGRILWNIVDVMVAIGLLISIRHKRNDHAV